MWRRDYLRRSLQASLAMALVQSRPLVALLVIVPLLDVAVSSTVAVASNAAAVAMVVATGCLVTAVRACAPLAKEAGSELRTAVARELGAASWLSAALVTVGVGVALIAGWRNLGQTSFFWYWLGALPGLAIAPYSFVFSGALRAMGRDSLVLANAAITTVIYGGGVAAIAFGGFSDRTALVGLGTISTAVTLASLVHLGHRAQRHGLIDGSTSKEHLGFVHSSARRLGVVLGERAAAAVDGLVFMVTFALATGIAAAHSPVAGVTVGLAVAVMRMIVVPIKQFGLVGAQMSLATRTSNTPFTVTHVRWNTAAVLTLATIVWLASFFLVPALGTIEFAIAIMMTMQILFEPWAGVHFAYRKVWEGPASGLGPLLVSYGLVGAVGLLAAGLLDWPAIGIWGVLFTARVVFMLTQTRTVAQHVDRAWW